MFANASYMQNTMKIKWTSRAWKQGMTNVRN
jgi:hypothetical protein